jgi:hypothetical protein
MSWLGSAVFLTVSGHYLSHPTGMRNPQFDCCSVDNALCRLSSITSYGHLLNLENLDISLNEVDSLRRELVSLVAKRLF